MNTKRQLRPFWRKLFDFLAITAYGIIFAVPFILFIYEPFIF
jgi:hypothetical protein